MSTTPQTNINPPSAETVQATRDMEETMLDTCIVHTRAEDDQDEYGMPGSEWTDSTATRCGYRTASRREVLGITQALVFDSVLRLPLSVAISNLDQVSVTHRMGRALPAPLRFKIVRLDDGMYQRTLYLSRAGQGAQQ